MKARTEVKGAWIKTWAMLRDGTDPPTLRHIAKVYGVDPAIVHRYTRTVQPPPGGWPAKHKRRFSRDLAASLEEAGWSRAKIAKHLGVTPAAITQALGPKMRSAA